MSWLKCHPFSAFFQVMSGKLVVGLNPHGEITSLMFPGRVALQKSHIMNCIGNAFSKAKASAEMIARVVDEDIVKRKALVKPDGYTNSLTSDPSYTRKKISKLVEGEIRNEFQIPQEPMEEDGVRTEDRMHDSEEEDEEEEPMEIPTKKTPSGKVGKKSKRMSTDSNSEEEEESAQTLTANDLQ